MLHHIEAKNGSRLNEGTAAEGIHQEVGLLDGDNDAFGQIGEPAHIRSDQVTCVHVVEPPGIFEVRIPRKLETLCHLDQMFCALVEHVNQLINCRLVGRHLLPPLWCFLTVIERRAVIRVSASSSRRSEASSTVLAGVGYATLCPLAASR